MLNFNSREYHEVGALVTPKYEFTLEFPNYIYGVTYETTNIWKGNLSSYPSIVCSKHDTFISALTMWFDLVKPPKRKGMRR